MATTAIRTWALLALIALSTPGAAQERSPLCIDSTFIQLWDEHRSWPQSRWEELFQSIRRLGVREVIVQWSSLDGRHFFTSTSKEGPGPVETILMLAKKHKMRVVMGLSHDTAYWKQVTPPDKALYMAERARQNSALIDALTPRIRKNRTVVSWYISEEIDDLNWNNASADLVLTEYLRKLATRLSSAGSARFISISAFANAQTSPDVLAAQWKKRLRGVPRLKRIYFQDGVGVGKIPVAEIPAYYAAVGRETKSVGVLLIPVVEVFTQVTGEPLDKQAYSAEPAPLHRLQAQILAARLTGKVSSFGVPEYLSPVGPHPAPQAYAAWISLLESRNEQCAPEQDRTW